MADSRNLLPLVDSLTGGPIAAPDIAGYCEDRHAHPADLRTCFRWRRKTRRGSLAGSARGGPRRPPRLLAPTHGRDVRIGPPCDERIEDHRDGSAARAAPV